MRLVSLLRSQWALVEATPETVAWSNRYDGFAVLNDRPDEEGYRLMLCLSADRDEVRLWTAVDRLSVAVAAVYLCTETGELPRLTDDGLVVETVPASLGPISPDEFDGDEYVLDPRRVTGRSSLADLFPDAADEIDRIFGAMHPTDATEGGRESPTSVRGRIESVR